MKRSKLVRKTSLKETPDEIETTTDSIKLEARDCANLFQQGMD